MLIEVAIFLGGRETMKIKISPIITFRRFREWKSRPYCIVIRRPLLIWVFFSENDILYGRSYTNFIPNFLQTVEWGENLFTHLPPPLPQKTVECSQKFRRILVRSTCFEVFRVCNFPNFLSHAIPTSNLLHFFWPKFTRLMQNLSTSSIPTKIFMANIHKIEFFNSKNIKQVSQLCLPSIS